MANIVITNNGNPTSSPAVYTYDDTDPENIIQTLVSEATTIDPALLITAEGFSKVLQPGECVGLDPTLIYTVSIQE